MPDHFGHIPIQSPESSPAEKKTTQKVSGAPGAAAPKGRSGSPKKFLIFLAALSFLVASYTALGLFGVPYYVTRILPEKFHASTGMVFAPSTVTFNPFTFRFSTGEVRILSATGTDVMSLQTLLADIAPASLVRLGILCNSLKIGELDLKLAKEQNGSYNFQQLFDTGKDQNQLPVIDFADLPFSFSLNNISITNSKVTFNDVPAGKIHTVAGIQLELPTLANSPFHTEQYLRPHFSAIVNGSPVELSGQTLMGKTAGQEQMTSLSLNLHNFDLTIYAGYLPVTLPLEIRKGTADGKIDLVFAPQNEGGDRLTLGFQLRISEAELSKESGAAVITIPTARLSGTLQPISRRLHFTEVALKNPTVNSFANLRQEKSSTAGKQAGHLAAADAQGAPSFGLLIDLLLIDNGTVRLHPEKDSPKHGSTWRDIQLSIQHYRSHRGKQGDQQSGTLSVSGEKEGASSSFSWQGTFSSPKSVSGSFTLMKIDCGDILPPTVDSPHPFKLRGSTDLRGRLILSAPEEPSSPLRYELTDTEVTIKDFALTEDGINTLTADVVRLSPLSLADNTVNFGNVHFQKGSARFSYGQLPKSFAALASRKVRLQGVDFNGKVTVSRPEEPNQHLIFTDVSLKANHLDDGGQPSDNLIFSGKTTTDGILKAQGKVGIRPFSLTVKTGFRELPATSIWPLFKPSPMIAHISGSLSGQGWFELPALRFAGELQLTDGVSGPPGEKRVSWRRTILRDMEYTAAPFHLGIGAIDIEGGRFPWEITSDNSEPVSYFSDIISSFAPSEEKQPAASIDIGEISLKKSRISIHDRRLIPDWQGEIADLTGKINHIQAAASKEESSFSFSGTMDNAPFTIHGTVGLFSEEKKPTLHFSIENYPLASFYRQLATKTDIDASDGVVKLTLTGKWQDQRYINSGELVLADLKPAAASELGVPLALLTGTDDTVHIPFDFSRTEPIAEDTLFAELLTSFQTKIIKGSVSPLLLAGEEFSELIGNEFIEFQPGEFILTPTGQGTLDQYGALLGAHPQIGLVLSGGVNKTADSQAMRKHLSALEKQRVALENAKRMKQWQERKALYQKNRKKLKEKAGSDQKFLEQDIPLDILAGFTPLQPVSVEIDDAMLFELAQKRIAIVYQYFTSELALQPGRISIPPLDILDGVPESPTNGVSISLKAISQ